MHFIFLFIPKLWLFNRIESPWFWHAFTMKNQGMTVFYSKGRATLLQNCSKRDLWVVDGSVFGVILFIFWRKPFVQSSIQQKCEWFSTIALTRTVFLAHSKFYYYYSKFSFISFFKLDQNRNSNFNYFFVSDLMISDSDDIIITGT